MRYSPEIDKVAAALVACQADLRPALKDKENPFFKSNYADLLSVWRSSHETMAKHGLAIIQTNKPHCEGVVVVTTLLHASGQYITDDGIFVAPTKQDAQGFVAANTYGKRTGWAGILGLVAEDDDDGETAAGKPPPKKAATKKAPPKKAATKKAPPKKAPTRKEEKENYTLKEYDTPKGVKELYRKGGISEGQYSRWNAITHARGLDSETTRKILLEPELWEGSAQYKDIREAIWQDYNKVCNYILANYAEEE